MDSSWNQETPEHIKYTKLCRLLYDGGTLALKTVFDTQCPPASLATTLATNRPTLLTFRRRRVLHQDQWELFYPPSGASPESENFDITSLSFLLRNICSLPAPLKFKTQKIRKCRNKITAHRPKAKVNDSDFETYWNEISSALVSLGVNQDDIDKLKSSPLGEENYNKLMENWEFCDREIERQLELMKTDLAEIKSVVHNIDSKMSNIQQFEISTLAEIDYTGLIRTNCQTHHPYTREWIFNQVEKNRKEVTPGASVVLIKAGPGMGKSIVAAKICQIYKKKRLLGGCHFFENGNKQRKNPRIMLQSIASQLCESVPGYQAALETKLKKLQVKTPHDMECTELFGVLFEEPLNKIKINHNVVIVIDALDECESQLKKELEDSFQKMLSRLPSFIRFVITARVLPSLSHLSSAVEIPIDPSDQKNIDDIHKFLSHELAKQSADHSHLDKLMEISQGLFLVASFVLQYLDQPENQSFPNAIKHLPHGITSVYEYYFSRIKDVIKPYLQTSGFNKMLEVVVATESPLPKIMFYEILSLKNLQDFEPEKRREINDAVLLLHTVFPIENDHVSVFHKTVIEWLKSDSNKNPEFSVAASNGVEVLAEKSLNALKVFKKKQIPLHLPLRLSDCERFLFLYGTGYIMESSEKTCSEPQKEEIRNNVLVLAVSSCIKESFGSYPLWLEQLSYYQSLPTSDQCIGKPFGDCLRNVETVLHSPLSTTEKQK